MANFGIKSLCLYVVIIQASLSEELSGHLKPLGHHRKPTGGITILKDFPSPIEFYENYLEKSKPFLVKGVLENGQFPAYKLWTDKYLDKKYGKIYVDVEGGKKENRQAKAYTMPMSKFLDIYNESNVYMVYDVANEMRDDITIPISLQCGGLQRSITSVIMWFSSGGTKSVLHNDGLDNINCLLDGNKDLIMFDKKYKQEIEGDHFVHQGAYSMVDVEAVDMKKYPKLQGLPWYLVNMTKGDCLFIPYHWYHHVYSHSGRNLAVNVWSHHLRWFNKTDCQSLDGTLAPKSLKHITLMEEEMTEENEIREMFLDAFDELMEVSKKDFLIGIRKYSSEDTQDEKLVAIFNFIDRDKNDILTMYEFHVCDYAEMFQTIPNLETIFSVGREEPVLNSYYNKEPTVLEMDDDVTFLKTKATKLPEDRTDNIIKDENLDTLSKEEL